MKRALLSTILLVSTVFLVVLGMRNPSLDHNHGPKQRPRAVLEEVVKSSLEKVCHVPSDAAIVPSQVPPIAPADEAGFVVCEIVRPISPPAPASRQSRAPPAPLSAVVA